MPVLSLGSIVTRTGVICVALAWSVFPFILVHSWLTILHRLRRDYPANFAMLGCGVVPVFLVIGGLYAWLARWPFGWITGVVRRAAAIIPVYETGHLPIWLGIVALVTVAIVAFVLLRPLVPRHLLVSRVYGLKKTLWGYGVMTILRLRQPRRDFFAQAPLIRDVRVLAVAAVLFEAVQPRLIAWPLATLLVAASVGMSLHLLLPPVWVFLGRSNFDSFRSFDRLRDSWRQFGVTLLDRDSREWIDYYFTRATEQARRGVITARFMNKPKTPREWSLRSRGDLWESTVALLMKLASVVVIDVRAKSYYVYDEVLWVAELNWMDKVWLLGNPDGTAPALEGALEWAALFKSICSMENNVWIFEI